MNPKKNIAFSLTELSISVVIISVLIAAVTTAISLQKQGQIRILVAEINNIQSAFSTFKLQYNALPGDISNAITIWPSASTANGDGNGIINWNINNNSPLEDTYVFQHLYLGGMLPNIFSGGYQSSRYVRGSNTYPSKLFNGAYQIAQGYYFGYGANYNIIGYGIIGSSDSCSGLNSGAVMVPSDGYQLDLKIDDGYPSTGKLLGANSCSGSSNCTSGSNYNYSNISNACIHAWMLD